LTGKFVHLREKLPQAEVLGDDWIEPVRLIFGQSKTHGFRFYFGCRFATTLA